jgi:hypothetical protein
MNVYTRLFVTLFLIAHGFLSAQDSPKFHQKFRIGFDATVHLALNPISEKQIDYEESFVHFKNGSGEPLPGGIFYIGFDLNKHHGFALRYTSFNYNYEYNQVYGNLPAGNPQGYERYFFTDYTEFYYQGFFVNYQYSLDLKWFRPFAGLSLGNYLVELKGYQRLNLSDEDYNSEMVEHNDIQSLSYFSIIPTLGMSAFINPHVGVRVFTELELPLNSPIHYNYSYDNKLDPDIVEVKQRTFNPSQLLNFGLGFIFKIH